MKNKKSQSRDLVAVGLADGTLSLFSRLVTDSTWDTANFITIIFDKPHHSIRVACNVNDTIWSGCRNKIHVYDPIELCVLVSHCFISTLMSTVCSCKYCTYLSFAADVH